MVQIKYIDLRWEDARYIKLDNNKKHVEGNTKRDFTEDENFIDETLEETIDED